MKTHTTIVLALLGSLALAAPSLICAQEGPEAMIEHARAVVLAPHFSSEEITRALIEVLDASLLILPETDYAAEFVSRIGTVKKMFEEGSLFSDKMRQYLGFSYKLVNGGVAWKIPEELKASDRVEKGIELAKKICVKLLDSALAERKAGRNERSVRDLVGFVLLVVTPMEA
jgi:hypothetical protein